jgi:hypothetical protein
LTCIHLYPKNKHFEDLIDTDASDESSEEEEDGDEYDNEPDIIEAVEATDTKAVFRVETIGLLDTDTIKC